MLIWLLEDDPAQADLLVNWLQEEGHEVQHFDRGHKIVAALAEGDFDLIVLDWELPDTTGTEVLEQIRKTIAWHVPVLFVTQREAETDIVAALSLGADDYMVKQISKPEFMARVTALGRRLTAAEESVEIGPYVFQPTSKSILLDSAHCDLTAKDFDLAWYLFRHVDRLLSREQLLKDVWGVSGLNTRTVDVHVSRLRKRLQIGPERGYRIKTIYQHGYRLEKL
jgi:DNA-binding response OmpR family regulator